jgi:hypothetical protein
MADQTQDGPVLVTLHAPGAIPGIEGGESLAPGTYLVDWTARTARPYTPEVAPEQAAEVVAETPAAEPAPETPGRNKENKR